MPGAVVGPEMYGKYLSICEVEPTATVIRSPECREAQKRVWDELIDKLDKVEPGVSRWNRYSPLYNRGMSLSQASVKAEGPESHSQEQRQEGRLGNDDIGGACSTPLLG